MKSNMRSSILSLCFILFCFTVFAQSGDQSQVVFKNVRVFNGISETLSAATDVLIEGNIIKEISTNASQNASNSATVIDGEGKVLMPGLIDGHVHLTWNTSIPDFIDGHPDYIAALALAEANRTLMRGFTTVRDIGGQSMGVRQAIDEGFFVGPRIHSAGAAICMTSGHADFRSRSTLPRQLGGPAVTELESQGMTVFADGEAEVLSAARNQFRKGANFLKMFVGGAVSGLRDPLDIGEYSFDEMKAAADEAKRWNSYLAVHGYTDRSIKMALEAGAMSIEHAHLLSEETMKLLVEKGAYLSTQTGFFLAPPPASFSEAQKARQQTAANGLENQMQLAKKYKAKVTFGTDFVGSMELKATQLNELTNRLKWFSPAEVLIQATSNTAELLELCGPRNPYDGKIGVVEKGALADLLLINGNPLEDLSIMKDYQNNMLVIMKDGKIYKNTFK